jgi:RIO kinase 1
MDDDDQDVRYGDYATRFDPLYADRQARRKRKPKVKHTPKVSSQALVQSIADTQGLEGGFNPTYKPGLFEEAWLLDAIRPFYDGALISDVMARVKGGKEANVYRCQAHPSIGTEWLAAKVYRPRMFRNLRNDAMYREGRAFIKEDGRGVKKPDQRIMRALQKKTTYGLEIAHISWLQYEMSALNALHLSGAHVPKPYASSANAILMSYYGDEGRAAPTLHEVRLTRSKANDLFDILLNDVALMLKQGLIHGDLSAYNILYWQGEPFIIDFPQVIYAQVNTNARLILARDIERLCDYFNAYGLRRDPIQIAEALWMRFVGKTSDDLWYEMGFGELGEPNDD